MGVKLSTGFRTALMGANGVDTIMNLGFIKIYTGTVPASPDDALGSAVLLNTISNNSTGTGLTLGTAAAGVISKTTSEVWSGVSVASGTPTFFRHVLSGDTGASSSTDVRIQGAVAVVGADLNMTNASFTSGGTETVTVYNITMPAG